jgi:hypothetical protein
MSEEEQAALIAKIENLPPGEIIIFNRSEAEALREVATWWLRFRGAAQIGGVLGSAMKWAILFGVFLAALKSGLLDFVGLPGGGK